MMENAKKVWKCYFFGNHSFLENQLSEKKGEGGNNEEENEDKEGESSFKIILIPFWGGWIILK